MRSRLLTAALLLPFLPACGGENAERLSDVLALEGDIADGGDFYLANCETCHGADAMGGTNLSGPNIAGAEIDVVVEATLEGPKAMPAFGSSSDQELADVAAYVASL